MLENGQIKIVPGKGTALLYDLTGRRQHEIKQDMNGRTLNKTLSYFDNNLLHQTDVDGSAITFDYDNNVARRQFYTTDTTKITTQYQNDFIVRENTS